MAVRAASFCPGCKAIMRDGPGRCAPCEAKKRAYNDRDRGSAASRGYGRAWRTNRLHMLQREPWCRLCREKGLWVLADLVDHIEPHRRNAQRFWNVDNWQPLCGSCHTQKTAAGL